MKNASNKETNRIIIGGLGEISMINCNSMVPVLPYYYLIKSSLLFKILKKKKKEYKSFGETKDENSKVDDRIHDKFLS